MDAGPGKENLVCGCSCDTRQAMPGSSGTGRALTRQAEMGRGPSWASASHSAHSWSLAVGAPGAQAWPEGAGCPRNPASGCGQGLGEGPVRLGRELSCEPDY